MARPTLISNLYFKHWLRVTGGEMLQQTASIESLCIISLLGVTQGASALPGSGALKEYISTTVLRSSGRLIGGTK